MADRPKTKIAAEEDKSPKAKRPRNAADDSEEQDGQSDASLPHLTADLWAIALPFLPYGDNLQCTAVSRSFLHYVAPRIMEITVFSSKEMKMPPARRFRGVEKVKIACLYRRRRTIHVGDRYGEYGEAEDHGEGRAYVDTDKVTASLVVPFLSAFPSLKEAALGWYANYGRFEVYGDSSYLPRTPREAEEILAALQRALCGAYRSKLIPSDAVINGADVLCANARSATAPEERGYCSECVDYTECFPLEYAANTIDCSCFPFGKGIDIILARPGGKAHLVSSGFLLSMCFGKGEWWQHVLSALRDRELLPNTVSRQEVLEYLHTKKEDYYSITSCSKEDVDTWRRFGIPVECSDFAHLCDQEDA